MKRIGYPGMAMLALGMTFGAAVASATPNPNGAFVKTRIFNDCATSTGAVMSAVGEKQTSPSTRFTSASDPLRTLRGKGHRRCSPADGL